MGDRPQLPPNVKMMVRRFKVEGSRSYIVTAIEGTGHGAVGSVWTAVACTCPDFEHRVHSCKHMRRVEQSREGLTVAR